VGEPILAGSFNLHNGFDEAGGFALDEMLLALRREDADVVALQEVSRGWVINGSADLFELSREALGLPGIPGPSVTPDWGNAVFTRWPARASRVEPLPPDDLPLPRAVLIVDLEAPEDETRQLRILATHWHQVTDDHSIRNEQARFIVTDLEAPADTMPSLLLGDFNALPDSECMAILAAAGWHDVFGVTDPEAEVDRDALTNPSDVPHRRIDTILYRGPWRLLRAEAAPPWGSDHRAVVAELLLERRLQVGERDRTSPPGTVPVK
jgi:endonuclease/exonuclease/phosphatase family metal-dependent hydrolase